MKALGERHFGVEGSGPVGLKQERLSDDDSASTNSRGDRSFSILWSVLSDTHSSMRRQASWG